MREIKFRAWDKERKNMVHEGIEYEMRMLDVRQADVAQLHIGFGIADAMGFEIMQYTGLKDKNGKEIYEGDIVKSGKQNWEIVWSEPMFMMSWVNGTAQIFINEMVEVIGNIYETPEMIAKS